MDRLIFEKDGKVFVNPLRYLNKVIYNPSIAQLEAAGYHLRSRIKSVRKPVPIKFSKLKIIETLGDKWQEKKSSLEQAGVWDQFSQAEYLSLEHPVFRQFFKALTKEEQHILLKNCRWTKD